MIDFHSHALPGIDDGALDVEMSVKMLETSLKQGVEAVVLTPHYYPSSKSLDEFLREREEAYNKLISYASENYIKLPKLIKGAEVKFSEKLFEMNDITGLLIENTNALLLEMPFSYWNSWIFDKLYELAVTFDITIIIAHIERYIKSIKYFERIRPLLDMNFLIQVNSDSVFRWGRRKIVKKLFLENKVNLIGSDMHNDTTRKTTMDKAFSYIFKRYGEDSIEEITANEKSLIGVD